MQKMYNRKLSNVSDVKDFLQNVLRIYEEDDNLNEEQVNKISQDIAIAEMTVAGTLKKDTLAHQENRVKYVDDISRKQYRKKVYKELINERRLDDDEKITEGYGGVIPQTELCKDKQAFYIIGLPASGKSEIAAKLSDQFGAIILDSDYAKRKFPEYHTMFGASIVHEESSVVVFGGHGYEDEPSVLQYAIKQGCNIVIPKVGDVDSKVDDFAAALKDKEYKTHLILVRLDRRKATVRACKRYLKTKRYISLPLIFDIYSNDPTITFYDLQRTSKNFESFTMVSSDVDFGEPPELLQKSANTPAGFDKLFKVCSKGDEKLECEQKEECCSKTY